MVFQPFGYSFEIQSSMPPAKVKAAIRAGKKTWFDPKDGPRGWIAGPFICLWMTALSRSGPMLFGRISSDNFGTRISGRAGSDLNGVVWMAVLLLLMIFIICMGLRESQFSTRGAIIMAGLFCLLCALVFWINHKDRKHAEPLVRFIRNTVTPAGRALRWKYSSESISDQMRLTVNGEEQPGTITPENIHDALQSTGVGSFLILATAPERYMQTLLKDDGFVIERRDGDGLHHFKGVRRVPLPGHPTLFTFEETLQSLIAYGSNTSLSDALVWEPMHAGSTQ